MQLHSVRYLKWARDSHIRPKKTTSGTGQVRDSTTIIDNWLEDDRSLGIMTYLIISLGKIYYDTHLKKIEGGGAHIPCIGIGRLNSIMIIYFILKVVYINKRSYRSLVRSCRPVCRVYR